MNPQQIRWTQRQDHSSLDQSEPCFKPKKEQCLHLIGGHDYSGNPLRLKGLSDSFIDWITYGRDIPPPPSREQDHPATSDTQILPFEWERTDSSDSSPAQPRSGQSRARNRLRRECSMGGLAYSHQQEQSPAAGRLSPHRSLGHW